MGLVLDWLKEQGSTPAMEERNKAKSRLVYDVLDSSDNFYR